MITILNLITSNIYIYICIIIGLLILNTILIILATNQNKRRKIKNDFIEAEKVETELEKVEDDKVSNELEDILKKMEQDVNVTPSDVVKKFEEEQEEKAIISYKELVDNVKAGKIEVIDDEQTDINFVENLNLEDTSDIENEPIMEIDTESKVTPEMVKDAIETISKDSVKPETKKFKQSEFISPVFGIMEEGKVEYPKVKKSEVTLDLMNTNDYNELTEEIKRQEEFLKALIEFRNNL